MKNLKSEIDDISQLIKEKSALRHQKLTSLGSLCREEHPTFPTTQSEIMDIAIDLHDLSQEINRLVAERKFVRSNRPKCECGNSYL